MALSILAIDEAAGGHEWVEARWYINDDYWKIAFWLLTPKILHTIYREVAPHPLIKNLFITGYAFHSLYLLFEISDGEFYDVSHIIQSEHAKWGEEICELFFLAAYWLGFFFFYQIVSRRDP